MLLLVDEKLRGWSREEHHFQISIRSQSLRFAFSLYFNLRLNMVWLFSIAFFCLKSFLFMLFSFYSKLFFYLVLLHGVGRCFSLSLGLYFFLFGRMCLYFLYQAGFVPQSGRSLLYALDSCGPFSYLFIGSLSDCKGWPFEQDYFFSNLIDKHLNF